MKFSIRRLSSFDALFAKLSRKAARLGLPVPSYVVTGERMEVAEVYALTEFGRERVGEENVIVHDIEITGLDPVRLSGWNFVASVETLEGKTNLVYTLPGMNAPSKYKSTGCACDHCGVNRDRKKTFIVSNDKGEFRQVGSTCLQDFCGHNSPENLANMFAFWGEISYQLDSLADSEKTGWEGGSAAHDLRQVVSLSLAMQEKFGWLSKSKAFDQGGFATAARMRDKKCRKEVRVTPEHEAKADEIISYFAALEESEMQEQISRNANTIAQAGFCSDKSYGLAAALPVCYRVAMDRKDREARLANQQAASKFLFSPGERVKGIVATIKKVLTFESQWGTSVLTILEDAEGNVLTGKEIGKEGQTVRLTATVKEHKEYNGIKQTVLLRAKVEAVLS